MYCLCEVCGQQVKLTEVFMFKNQALCLKCAEIAQKHSQDKWVDSVIRYENGSKSRVACFDKANTLRGNEKAL